MRSLAVLASRRGAADDLMKQAGEEGGHGSLRFLGLVLLRERDIADTVVYTDKETESPESFVRSALQQLKPVVLPDGSTRPHPLAEEINRLLGTSG